MRPTPILCAVLALCAAAPLAVSTQAIAAPSAQVTTQLPRNAVPTHYEIELKPDAPAMRFDGKVTITLDIVKPSAAITLNARDLEFRSALLSAAGKSFKAPSISMDAKAQTATFTFDRTLSPGRYRLALDYSGKIGTQAAGLFAIDYPTPAGKKRALYTQFEAPDARAMVPSWDEPSYKATFALSAIVPSGQMAVSNMPGTAQDLGNGLQKVSFATSPKMSTYLLFFGLGEFDRATRMEGPTELGVVTKRGAAQQAQFALDASAEILREFNDYFGTPYPLPKLDNVAGPGSSQFFGAMENWGAIFTFEHTLLVDPAISTQADKQRIFSVAAHEIAHQWFGNLVTMGWWDDLWLNEGFASWMEGRTTERLRPEWNAAMDAVDGREEAMLQDALRTTHPVVQRIATVDQISQAFDSITYRKGEAVIRMLESYVGADAWRSGVRAYMKRHAYGNTASDDLWRAVEQAANKPVRTVARDFTLQPGIPLIRAGAPVCANGRTTVALTQDEFTRDRPGKKALRWHVPVTARVLGQEAASTLVAGKATLSLPGCGPVLVNAGQNGYYRTLDAPAAFAGLAGRFGTLPAIDQFGLLWDVWSLGMAGMQPVGDFMTLADTLPLEADPQAWGMLAGRYASLDEMYRGDAARQARLRAYAIGRLAPKLAQIGWEPRANELAPVAILRTRLIGTLGRMGEPGVLAEARRRYDASLASGQPLPAALRTTIMGVLASRADRALWDQLRAQAQKEQTPLIRDSLYKLLASVQDPQLARAALDLALSAEPGETLSADMISNVAARHPEMAFDFALANRDLVESKVDSSSRSQYIAGLAGGSADPAILPRLRDYAQKHLAADARRPAEEAEAAIANRIRTRKERLPEVNAWLDSKFGK